MVEGNDERAARSATAARRGAKTELPLRFYKLVEVREHDLGFAIVLDGRAVRTPGRKELVAPSRQVAQALKAEWEAQVSKIDPATMPLTRLLNSAIDGVVGAELEAAADAAKYAGSDLICYRSDFPEGLAKAQSARWDPILAWAQSAHGWQFVTSVGVVHVSQPPETLRSVALAICQFDAFALSGLHSITTLTGSVLLALAVAGGKLDAEVAWAAAHVDEDWQISKWGEDEEAKARRAFRWREMQAATLLMRASAQPSMT